MTASPIAIPIISAVVAPALLILACSSLIATTANRLSLLLDRVRELTREIERMHAEGVGKNQGKHDFVAMQLGRGAQRARLLQRALATLYLALGSLLLTSISVGVGTAGGLTPNFIVITVLLAVTFLLYASVLLIRESRIALAAVNAEMEYVRRLITP